MTACSLTKKTEYHYYQHVEKVIDKACIKLFSLLLCLSSVLKHQLPELAWDGCNLFITALNTKLSICGKQTARLTLKLNLFKNKEQGFNL